MTEENFEPLHNEMGHHITSGILNSGMAQIVKIICQFGSIIILSRLLLPSDFGLIAMAGPVYGFVMLFQDLGLGQATIQKATLTHDEVNTFFWINVGVGATLSILLALLSPVVGWYYGDHRVGPLTTAMGILIFINSLSTQHGALIQRRMQFKAAALLEALTNLSNLLVCILAALFVKGYWAIYLGLLAGTIIPVTGIWFIVKWRPTLPHFISNMRDMLKFGGGITTFNITNFLARNMDNVLIGRRWGDQELGLYDRSYKLLLFPLQRIIGPVGTIMVPVLSRLINEPERYRRIFLKTLGQLTATTWPGILWAIVLADPLIPLLLGQKWLNSISMFQPLALAGLLQVVNSTAGHLFISQGRTGEYARWGIFNVITCIIAFLIGLPYGALGVAIAYAASECIRTPLLWWYVARRGAVKSHDIIRFVIPQICGGAILAPILFFFRACVQDHIIGLLVGSFILAYAVMALTMSAFSIGRETLKETVSMIKRLLRHLVSREEVST